jgi:hypothetical protein
MKKIFKNKKRRRQAILLFLKYMLVVEFIQMSMSLFLFGIVYFISLKVEIDLKEHSSIWDMFYPKGFFITILSEWWIILVNFGISFLLTSNKMFEIMNQEELRGAINRNTFITKIGSNRNNN